MIPRQTAFLSRVFRRQQWLHTTLSVFLCEIMAVIIIQRIMILLFADETMLEVNKVNFLMVNIK